MDDHDVSATSASRAEDRLDLDAAATEIDRRRGAWEVAGYVVGKLTWRDAFGPPQALGARDETRDPDSVGVRCNRGPAVFAIVIFDGRWSPDPGGWADVEWFDGTVGDAVVRAVPDIASFGTLLHEAFERVVLLTSHVRDQVDPGGRTRIADGPRS